MTTQGGVYGLAHLRAGVCRLSSPGCLSFLHQVERECFTTKHQQIPGSINMIPKPMKPTPMIVADDLIPKPKVMARGTTPTKAKLTPAPMMAAGPRQADGSLHDFLGILTKVYCFAVVIGKLADKVFSCFGHKNLKNKEKNTSKSTAGKQCVFDQLFCRRLIVDSAKSPY